MTGRLLSCVLAASLQAPLLLAQQAPDVPRAAEDSAAQTPPVPATQPAGGLLQDGLPIKLQLLNKLDSRTAKEGDEIVFGVVNDVVVKGVTVLRRGSTTTGVVTQAAASRTMGRAGRLTFSIDDVAVSNGQKVPVRAYSRTSGENRTGEMIGMMLQVPVAAAPFFLLIHGTNTTFPRGTEITAFVNGDFRIEPGTSSEVLAAGKADEEGKTILQISSTPVDAQVQIDGSVAGSTPLEVRLLPGKHEISMKKAGYVDWSKTVDVSGDRAHIEAALEAVTTN